MPLERHSRPLIQCCAYTSTFRLHTSLYHTILKCQAPSPNVPPTRRVPGNLIWGFVLCFLAVGVLGVYKNRARVGCQLRIRGGRGACYRKVRPLAHPDLINVYFIFFYLSVLLHTILLLVLCHQFPGCVYRLMRYFHVLYVF